MAHERDTAHRSRTLRCTAPTDPTLCLRLINTHTKLLHYRKQRRADTIDGFLGWPFPMLKYKYTFQTKYTDTILSNSTRKLLSFEISKMLIAV